MAMQNLRGDMRRDALCSAAVVSPTPDQDLPVKKIGEYELSSRIGIGGMGVVYEGRHPLIGKRVAVKVLTSSFSREKELVERFIAEARAVNEIRHRGIVDIFSFGQLPDGSHYFVMEYLDGEPFDQLIKRRGPMPIGEVLSMMEEILDALDAAHAAGIIHRDIKPSNLFLVNQGRGRTYVKLLDFGIAKLGVSNNSDTPQTRASVILGTPDYISPEQARGRPISPRTDLYALGVVMFEMLTGERPFQGENTLATMWMHVEDKPPVASDVRPDIPQELDELILWAMEKDPADRPQSAEDMRAHIGSIRASLGPGGAPSGPVGARDPLVPALKPTPNPIAERRRPSNPAMPVVAEVKPQPQSRLETRIAPAPEFEDEPRTYLEPDSETREALRAVAADPQTVDTNPHRSAVSRKGFEPVTVAAENDPVSEDTANAEAEDAEAIKRGSGGLIASVGVLLVLAVVAVVLVSQELSHRGPLVDPSAPMPLDPSLAPTKPPVLTKPTTKPVIAPPPDKPVVEKSIEKPPAAQKPTVEKPVVKVDKKPEHGGSGQGTSAQQLQSRLAKLEAKLSAREAQRGEPDAVNRRFLGQAKKLIESAENEGDRRDAAAFLDEFASQAGL